MNGKCIEEGFIREKIDNAISGISIYKKIWRKHHKVRNNARTFAVIFPEHDDELEKYTLQTIEHFLEQTHYKKFFLIGTSEFSKEITSLKCCAAYELITDREMQLLMESLCFFMFQTNIIVVSLDQPYGRNASNILSYNKITKEDIIKKGIFAYEKDALKAAKLIHIKTKIRAALVTVIKNLLMYLPVRLLVDLYYKNILEKGRAVYESLLSEYDGHYMFPAPYPGTGDVYLAAMAAPVCRYSKLVNSLAYSK